MYSDFSWKDAPLSSGRVPVITGASTVLFLRTVGHGLGIWKMLIAAPKGCRLLKSIAYLLVVSLLPQIVRGSEHCRDLMEIDQSIPLLCKGRNADQTRKHVSGSQWWVPGGRHSCCPQLLS